MKKIVAMLLMLLLAVAAHAVPTVEQVQAEVNKGNYAQAESMMREVVQARPNSAKAHYIYAEVLAHNGRFGTAADEARLAGQIDPKIGFTQPEKFSAFEQLLEQQQRSAARGAGSTSPGGAAAPVVRAAPASHGSGIPGWLWGVGGAVIAVLVWRLVSATRARTAEPPAAWGGNGAVAPAGAPGYGGGYGNTGYGSSPGYGAPGQVAPRSGMLGTGVAAAGGFAAGMLAEKLLDGGRESPSAAAGSAAGGGLVPGMFDDAPASNPSADELERRSIDFGSGDGWGGGADNSADAGFDNGGGSSDDDGW